jgi:hypothetical protein
VRHSACGSTTFSVPCGSAQALRRLVDRYSLALLNQTARGSACNRLHCGEQRHSRPSVISRILATNDATPSATITQRERAQSRTAERDDSRPQASPRSAALRGVNQRLASIGVRLNETNNVNNVAATRTSPNWRMSTRLEFVLIHLDVDLPNQTADQ